jgi:hypothetical protein
VLDAAARLWHARYFINPADCHRPEHYEDGDVADMHYWSRTFTECFITARTEFLSKHSDKLFEKVVRSDPRQAMSSEFIGSMCEESWTRYFPLLPKHHKLREKLRRIRALDVMWGQLPGYNNKTNLSSSGVGAWMPVSMAHQVRLLKSVGLFDEAYHLPRNPWLAHNGQGISRVFNQSYHSVYFCDSYKAPIFKSWLKEACRYQHNTKDRCFFPFSQYGGSPVQADFVHHRVEAPEKEVEHRHKQLMYNRFGFTKALRLGQLFHDTGLLQDLYSFEYRPYADLSSEQRQMDKAEAVYPSNFLAYARNHAIIALASCNHGTQEMSVPTAVRNLYRLYVDTYECMGAKPDDDGVPVVMGFLPHRVDHKEDRPVVLYAGSLACLNTKLEHFCHSDANRGERVCAIYKQAYLNDATLLFTRLLRAERRKRLHEDNHRRIARKRMKPYPKEAFQEDLIELQDAYIEFLQTTVVGMLLEQGADLSKAPLHLLEPRELEVSMLEEDDNLVGNDYLTPRTQEIIGDMDFSGEANLTRTQLAILSLIPPNHRILGTLRLNQSTQILDLEHVKKQVQKDTIESNKKVWQKYSDALIRGAFAHKLLERDGSKIDFSFDMSAIKDPLRESEHIKKRMTTTHAQSSSSLSQMVRSNDLRSKREFVSTKKGELDRALDAVRARVVRDFERHNGTVPKIKCLAMLKVPEHMKRMLRDEYTNESSLY